MFCSTVHINLTWTDVPKTTQQISWKSAGDEESWVQYAEADTKDFLKTFQKVN
jgi:hypothetical protein